MHEGRVSESEKYDMRGYRVHFVFNTEKLNTLCEQWHASRPDDHWPGNETVDFVHDRPSGWLTTRSVLGYPLLQFPLGNSETISVARRFVSYASYEFQRPAGAQYADILEVVAGSKNERMALFQTFELDQCVGSYEYGKVPMFTVKGDCGFAVGFLGHEYRDTDAALPFKFRFDELAADKKVVVLPLNHEICFGKWLMEDIRFDPRKVDGQPSHILYISNAGSNSETDPDVRGAPAIQASSNDPGVVASCYIDVVDIPKEGYTGRDFEALAQLLFPGGYLAYAGVNRHGPDWDYVVEAKLVDAFVAGSAAAPDAAVYSAHVNPLIRVVSAGGAKQQMTVNTVNPAKPFWRIDTGGSGTLAPDGRFCGYTPQAEGNVKYEQNPVTGYQAALRSSLSGKPVDIVRIVTGFALLPLYSTMVVVNARQTHYFKLAAAGNNVQLTFCHRPWGGGEQVVAPEETEWSVLAGGGTVEYGVFKPGASSKFAVVQAIHKNPIYMQFAVIVIPVPLLSAAEFVTMRNGG